MSEVVESTGRVASGDVTLFYRRYGSGGGAPLLFHHGANYYDSADWIDVARQLARDREVAIFDARGYANSTWSPTKNYSIDAALADSIALIDHFGWEKAIFGGHSRGGGLSILLAAHFPERCVGLVIVDRPLHLPVGRHRSPDGKPVVGRPLKVYATVEEAIADTTRVADAPPGSKARARIEAFVKPVEGGFAITGRDPDRSNDVPTEPPGWKSKFEHDDLWPALAKVKVPTILVRGTLSDRYPPEALERLAREFPHIVRVDVPSGHDVVNGAPDDLVRHVRRFLRDTVDAPASA